jgi:hypothetical protein
MIAEWNVTTTNDTVVLRRRLNPDVDIQTMEDLHEEVDWLRGDDPVPFEVFRSCLSDAAYDRAELGDLEVDKHLTGWDGPSGLGTIVVLCKWMSYYGCSDMDGPGIVMADVHVELNRSARTISFTSTTTPERPPPMNRGASGYLQIVQQLQHSRHPVSALVISCHSWKAMRGLMMRRKC